MRLKNLKTSLRYLYVIFLGACVISCAKEGPPCHKRGMLLKDRIVKERLCATLVPGLLLGEKLGNVQDTSLGIVKDCPSLGSHDEFNPCGDKCLRSFTSEGYGASKILITETLTFIDSVCMSHNFSVSGNNKDVCLERLARFGCSFALADLHIDSVYQQQDGIIKKSVILNYFKSSGRFHVETSIYFDVDSVFQSK